MSTDSAHQLNEARSLVLSDHHPIAMSLIWHALDLLVPGPFLLLVMNSVLYWFGLTAIFATMPWPLLLRALAIPAVGFFPPVFSIDAYLHHRARVYSYVAGIAGSRAKMNYWSRTQYRKAYPLSQSASEAMTWFESLGYTLWFKAWPYLLVSALVAPFAAWIALRGRSLLPLVLVLSGVSYAASMFLAAGAPDYRYSVWTILASVLALLTLAQPRLFRRRSPASSSIDG